MQNIKGKIYLALAFSLAGTSVVTGHILTQKLGSFTITALSLGILMICLTPFFAARAIAAIRSFKPADWRMILLQAVFGIFLFRAFFLFGVERTSTVEAGIFTGVTPAITSLLAFIFLKEPLSKSTLAGIVCTVSGILLIQGFNLSGTSFNLEHIWGNMLVLCAASSESVFNVLSRKHSLDSSDRPELHPMVQTLLVCAISFVLSLIPALFEHPLTGLQTVGIKEWLALAWYGLIVTALAFVFFYKGVRRCSAYITATFSGMMPFTSMLLSLLLLGENITLAQWIGGGMIIVSMLAIGSLPKPRKKKIYICERN